MVVQHTVDIFERMVKTMPPLVPRKTAQDAKQALEQVQNNMHLGIDELEDTMVTFGMKLWPYREAFLEMYRVYEGQVGETFLKQRMGKKLKKTYSEYTEAGGDYRQLHDGGGPLHLFSPEERLEIIDAFIAVEKDVFHYAKQAVLAKDRKRYEKKIDEFQHIFEKISIQLEGLREMAEMEQEHPELAQEMREHVRGFEHSLCLLGPRLDHIALANSGDHFVARKEHKKGRL